MTALILTAVAVLLALAISNTATWAITRIRARRASYRAAKDAGYVAGRTIGYHEGFGAGEMHHAAEYGEVTR